MKLFCLGLVLIVALSHVQGENSKINPKLQKSLLQKNSADVFVSMKNGGTKPILDKTVSNFKSATTHAERTTSVYEALTSHAVKSQSTILSFLRENHPDLEITSFWITNQVYIKHADKALIEKLASLDQVSEIQEEEIVYIENFYDVDSSSEILELNRKPQAINWGIEQIGAPQVWAQGIDGQGLIVGNIDTGVRGTHVLLRNKWVGLDNYGWYDPENKTSDPHDRYNHGTHTMGTLVGGQGMGVAPGALWMACKGYRDDGTALSSTFIACGQYMTCPVNFTGANPDCSKAPHVVSNSWGWNGGVTQFNPVLSAWKAARILASFSAGNRGPSCSTNYSPADQPDAISVGSHGTRNYMSSFSSRGPSPYGQLKPDITAPGESILSASALSDISYAYKGGTSMSCPHASGVLVLMKAFDRNLSHERARAVLTETASDAIDGSFGIICCGIADNVLPNNQRGYGAVDVAAAIAALRQSAI